MEKSNLQVLKEEALTRNISAASTEVAAVYTDRKQSITALRELGLSCAEIGAYFGISRQRVDQIIGPRFKALKTRPIVRGDKPPEEVAREIWAAALHDWDWWGIRSGRLLKKQMVEKFRSYNYTYPASREYAAKYSISKLEVILSMVYDVEPTPEAVRAWLEKQSETRSRDEILELVNSHSTKIDVSWYTFARSWRDLGLPVSKRRTRKQIEAGLPKFSA